MSHGEKVRVKMIDVPFNYEHPKTRRVTVVRDLGPCLLPDYLAQAAISGGYAVPFNPAADVPSLDLADDQAEDDDDAADENEPDLVDRENDADDGRADDVDPDDDDAE